LLAPLSPLSSHNSYHPLPSKSHTNDHVLRPRCPPRRGPAGACSRRATRASGGDSGGCRTRRSCGAWGGRARQMQNSLARLPHPHPFSLSSSPPRHTQARAATPARRAPAARTVVVRAEGEEAPKAAAPVAKVRRRGNYVRRRAAEQEKKKLQPFKDKARPARPCWPHPPPCSAAPKRCWFARPVGRGWWEGGR
jgi:hypothetical protein